MVKTVVKSEGMMCAHCEAHMNDAIRNAFKVKKVESSHKKGETVIISEQAIAREDLEKAIEPTGYVIKDITSEPYEKKGLFGR